jgi:hypothetical protein
MSSWWSGDVRAGPTHAPTNTGPRGSFPAVRELAVGSCADPREVGWVQVVWMVIVTLLLALSGVLALALVAHVADRAKRR